MAQSDERNARTGAVAAALGVAPATVQSYARSGRIPYRLTPGKQYRFNVDEVLDVLGRGELTSDALRSVFGESSVLVDGRSAYREDPLTPAVRSRLRTRAVRPKADAARPTALLASAGACAFTELVRASSGVAVAVLHREPAGA